MVDYYKAEELKIPEWLITYLQGKTFFVLGQEIPVGAIILVPLEWVVEVLKEIIAALNIGFADLDNRLIQLKEVVDGRVAILSAALSVLANRVAVLEGKLPSLVETAKDTIEGWVSAWTKPTRDLVVTLAMDVQRLSADFVDLKYNWWSPAAIIEAIGAAIYDVVSPFKKSKEDTKNFFEWLWLFFDDPPKFLYEAAEEVIVRFL